MAVHQGSQTGAGTSAPPHEAKRTSVPPRGGKFPTNKVVGVVGVIVVVTAVIVVMFFVGGKGEQASSSVSTSAAQETASAAPAAEQPAAIQNPPAVAAQNPSVAGSDGMVPAGILVFKNPDELAANTPPAGTLVRVTGYTYVGALFTHPEGKGDPRRDAPYTGNAANCNRPGYSIAWKEETGPRITVEGEVFGKSEKTGGVFGGPAYGVSLQNCKLVR